MIRAALYHLPHEHFFHGNTKEYRLSSADGSVRSCTVFVITNKGAVALLFLFRRTAHDVLLYSWLALYTLVAFFAFVFASRVFLASLRILYAPLCLSVLNPRLIPASIITAGNEYHLTSANQHQHPTAPNGHEDLPSPTAARYAQSFYPTHPAPQHPPGAGAATLPPAHNAMDSFQSRAPTLTASRAATVKDEEDEESRRALFGDVPESKRRKFILVEDQQRGTRVRVRVLLENVKMDDMPDSHLRSNAVYPRSYFPRQMRSPPGSPASRWDDEDDTQEGVSGTLPTRGKTLVPVQLMDGSDTKLPMPRMTKSRRNKEVALNELGYRMAWGQARTFSERTLFLQRSRKSISNRAD